MAELSGIHPNYISDVERGKRNISIINLTYLAGAFDMSPGELLLSTGFQPQSSDN